MSETIWREDGVYAWAVTKWELLYTCGGRRHDVADEYGVEMGTPEKLRAAIIMCMEDSDSPQELHDQLIADLDALIAAE